MNLNLPNYFEFEYRKVWPFWFRWKGFIARCGKYTMTHTYAGYTCRFGYWILYIFIWKHERKA